MANTFFCVGENVLRNPDLIQRIRDEGHAIGGHCMRHENSAKTHWKVYRNSVQECQKILKTRLFRPPYGRLSQWRAFQIAKEFQIVMWSWLSYDFDPKMEVDIIKKSAKKHIRNGSILVLHDNQKMSERIKTILPVVIEICRSKGLEFAIIPEPSKKS